MSWQVDAWRLIISEGEWAQWLSENDLSEYDVVNRGRLSAGLSCPFAGLLRYGAGIVRDTSKSYKGQFARELGKAIHNAMEALSLGEGPVNVAAGFDEEMTSKLTGVVLANEGDPTSAGAIDHAQQLTAQWIEWMDAAAPVLSSKITTGPFGAVTGVLAAEHPVVMVNASERVIVCTVPDAIATWNDGVWGYETKSIAANKDLHHAANSYARSLQVTLQSLATRLWAERGDKPFMGTMLQFVSKRSIPTHPDDVKCAKLCECGASTMDATNMLHDEILAVAAKHPRKGDDPEWIRSHVMDEVGKVERFEQRQRKARLESSEWPERIFHVEPKVLSTEVLSRRLTRDLPMHLEGWRRLKVRAAATVEVGREPDAPRQGEQCYVFSPCGYCGAPCDATAEWWSRMTGGVLPEGWKRREPDYVDVIEGGEWALDAYDAYEWDDDEGGE